MERTLVIIKPDGIKRRLAGEIISRFEKRALKLVAMMMLWLSEDRAQKLYDIHEGKEFYQGLVDFMTSGHIIPIAVEGRSAIKIVRNILGALNPEEARPGSIRGDYSVNVRHNVVHASDSRENAFRELAVFFEDGDYMEYHTSDEDVLYTG